MASTGKRWRGVPVTSYGTLPTRWDASAHFQLETNVKYDAGASAYDRLTGRWSRLYAQAMLDAAGVSVGSVVLDLATGTGDAALLAGSRVQMGGVATARIFRFRCFGLRDPSPMHPTSHSWLRMR